MGAVNEKSEDVSEESELKISDAEQTDVKTDHVEPLPEPNVCNADLSNKAELDVKTCPDEDGNNSSDDVETVNIDPQQASSSVPMPRSCVLDSGRQKRRFSIEEFLGTTPSEPVPPQMSDVIAKPDEVRSLM